MKNKEIIEELREIGVNPDLFPESTGFGLPEGYFDRLKDEISMEVSKERFDVPEGYFEGLKDDILNQTSRKTRTPVIRLWSRVAVTVAAASVILAFVIRSFMITNVETEEVSFAALEIEDVEAYLIENIDEWSVEWIVLEDETEVVDGVDVMDEYTDIEFEDDFIEI